MIHNLKRGAVAALALLIPLTVAASSEAAAEAMGARLVVLEDCGHVPYVEQQEQLLAAIRTHLGHSADS